MAQGGLGIMIWRTVMRQIVGLLRVADEMRLSLTVLLTTLYNSCRDMPWHVRFQQHSQMQRLMGGQYPASADT